MEARKRLTSRRALLPQDIQLIEAVGITQDEFYDFLDQCEYACEKRSEEYSHIPDVRNTGIDPVSLALIQIAIGIALQVAGTLLAPKPKSPDDRERPQLQTGDKTGRSRFTPYNDFDSVQELAALGTTVPLVYAAGNPGVRVNTQLLWSNIDTVRNAQVAKLLLLVSQGKLEQMPDFAGLAIGDTLLENFDRARLGAWFRTDGGRIKEKTDAYKYPSGEIIGDLQGISVPDDVFSIKEYANNRWYPWHSGARTPGTATAFGLYNFVPNGNRFKLNYELILIQDGAGKDTKAGQREKRDKINKGYPTLAGIIRIDNKRIGLNSTNTERHEVRPGAIIEYVIRKEEKYGRYDGGRWGLQTSPVQLPPDVPPQMTSLHWARSTAVVRSPWSASRSQRKSGISTMPPSPTSSVPWTVVSFVLADQLQNRIPTTPTTQVKSASRLSQPTVLRMITSRSASNPQCGNRSQASPT